MIYGHIETAARIRMENPLATDDGITEYLKGQDHSAYKWARMSGQSDKYNRGFDGLPFSGE